MLFRSISNDVTYNLRKDISKKINRLPMNYFESRTNGEILSRVTNDVDTLQMSINQSMTQPVSYTHLDVYKRQGLKLDIASTEKEYTRLTITFPKGTVHNFSE